MSHSLSKVLNRRNEYIMPNLFISFSLFKSLNFYDNNLGIHSSKYFDKSLNNNVLHYFLSIRNELFYFLYLCFLDIKKLNDFEK
jgi:hypothetical protein